MKTLNIQLYSVKKSLEKDFEGTLEKLSDMGFDGVEFCGNYGGMSGDELSRLLERLGLDAAAAHVGLDEIEDDERFKFHADMLKKIGCMYIVNPYVDLKSADEAVQYGMRLEKAAEKCAKNGFLFAHHNHGSEIERKDENGISYFDIMMSQTELTLAEFDIFWLKHAGADIEQYLRQYSGKINLIHLKQMKDEVSKQSSSLDDGIIDINKTVELAEKFGTETFIYENEQTENELEAAEKSIKYFMK